MRYFTKYYFLQLHNKEDDYVANNSNKDTNTKNKRFDYYYYAFYYLAFTCFLLLMSCLQTKEILLLL